MLKHIEHTDELRDKKRSALRFRVATLNGKGKLEDGTIQEDLEWLLNAEVWGRILATLEAFEVHIDKNDKRSVCYEAAHICAKHLYSMYIAKVDSRTFRIEHSLLMSIQTMLISFECAKDHGMSKIDRNGFLWAAATKINEFLFIVDSLPPLEYPKSDDMSEEFVDLIDPFREGHEILDRLVFW